MPTFHLIGNAHLDPVWLWDWREGLNEGLVTCRTICNLMDEFPELTFTRGEAAIYAHIERYDPETFLRIRRFVEDERWDVVGGTYVQPDTNMPATETFVRQYLRGQRYFASRFGKAVTVAWAADSFGHAAGLPEILAQSGIRAFAFTRPDTTTLPLAKPAFWWESPNGVRVLAYRPPVGWYGCEREELFGRLEACLQHVETFGLENIAIFWGLGNHGGGPTRGLLAQILRWRAAHPEVNVTFSGLHQYFDALWAEIAQHDAEYLPTHRGEMNYCLRGCYASVAKLKYSYRRAEAAVSRAETTDTAISTLLGLPSADLSQAWDGVLFNSFHDILPGSIIERAVDDQLAWIGGITHASQQVEFTALTTLAQQVDTRVPPAAGDFPSPLAGLVWNPLPVRYDGYLEWEASLDYRLISAYAQRRAELPLQVCDPAGHPLPFQRVASEHQCFEGIPWRERVLFPVSLPPLGWSIFTFGWVEGAMPPEVMSSAVCAPAEGVISNGRYVIEAAVGRTGITITRDGIPLLTGEGLTARVYEDSHGSWGAFDERETQHARPVKERWHITRVETLEQGPLRAKLWVRLAGAHSQLDLTLALTRDRDAVDIDARLFINERAARVQLIFPGGEVGEFEVPAASVRRDAVGDVPGGRWVRITGADTAFGFASNALYSFELRDGEFRATLARAGHYAREADAGPEDLPWRPTVDHGELTCRLLLAPNDETLSAKAAALEYPASVLHVPAKTGARPRAGSLAALLPASLRLLACKPAEDGTGVILRVQQSSDEPVAATLSWLGQSIELGTIAGRSFTSWRLLHTPGGWQAERVDCLEQSGKLM